MRQNNFISRVSLPCRLNASENTVSKVLWTSNASPRLGVGLSVRPREVTSESELSGPAIVDSLNGLVLSYRWCSTHNLRVEVSQEVTVAGTRPTPAMPDGSMKLIGWSPA